MNGFMLIPNSDLKRENTTATAQSEDGLEHWVQSSLHVFMFSPLDLVEADGVSKFTSMIDDMVEFADFDPELKDAIAWVDEQSQKKGITFYDMIYEILQTHETQERAKEWMDEKKND